MRSHSVLRVPPPETRPRSAPTPSRASRSQRVAQAEGHALEDGADQRAAVVAEC